ncbi:MAG: hypothetical protein PHG67_01135 [Bacteroidales bacterium]|jgi:translation initiation factor IF-1|nr:hypothetical protein [Bacteroidales bacterium]
MKTYLLIFNQLLLTIFFFSLSAGAQTYTKENSITKAFPVTTNTEIEVSNKYGNITIENWEVDSVKFVINYKVTSNKYSRLDKNFESIDFEFNANNYFITVNTMFAGKSSFWSDVSDIAGNLFSAGTHTSVEYTIYLPETQTLGINLKYGNVYLGNHKGRLKLDVSNGDVRANNISGSCRMDISFGDVTINKLSDAKISLSYGVFSLRKGEKINLSGRSSEVEIDEIDFLALDSKRDKLTIENAGIITGETSFSKAEIQNISGYVSLVTRYGSMKLSHINTMAEKIELQSNSTDVELNIGADQSFLLKLLSDEKAYVTYSTEIGNISTEKISLEDFTYQAETNYGNGKDPLKLDIKIKSGSLAIKLN